MRSRIATVFTVLALLGGTGGAIALAGQGSSGGPAGGAASGQYKPGKGCGDKNHKHKKHEKCKKHHKGKGKNHKSKSHKSKPRPHKGKSHKGSGKSNGNGKTTCKSQLVNGVIVVTC
jgi:hypothetical protein